MSVNWSTFQLLKIKAIETHPNRQITDKSICFTFYHFPEKAKEKKQSTIK